MQLRGMHMRKAEPGLHNQDAPAGLALSTDDMTTTPAALPAGGCVGADLDSESCVDHVTPAAPGPGAVAQPSKPQKEKKKGKKKGGHRRRVSGRMIST